MSQLSQEQIIRKAKVRIDKDDFHKEEFAYFLCPACKKEHKILISATLPTPMSTNGAWKFNNDVNNPTFFPSIKVTYDTTGGNEEYIEPQFIIGVNICHSFVKDGRIEYLPDCTHKLVNQTIELPEI